MVIPQEIIKKYSDYIPLVEQEIDTILKQNCHTTPILIYVRDLKNWYDLGPYQSTIINMYNQAGWKVIRGSDRNDDFLKFDIPEDYHG